MKWGRKKAISSSSPRPSLISSWLFKFKKLGNGSSSEQKLDRGKHRGRLNSTGSTSSQRYTGDKRGRFYGEDGDAFWRISFEEEGVDGRTTSKGVVRSAWDKKVEPELSCNSCRSNSIIAKGSEETLKFSSMVSNARKMREFLSDEARLLPKSNTSCRRKTEEKLDTPRRVARKDCELISKDRRCQEVNLLGSLRTIRNSIYHSGMHDDNATLKGSEDCDVETSEKDCVLSRLNMDKLDVAFNGDASPDWQELKQTKIAEFKAKTEKQRKSVYMSRELQMNKPKQCNEVRVFSPRTISRIETCKIKALEDIKKAKRLKVKRKIRERIVGGKSNLENFAVVKCSYDPGKDFRDSMIEMIVEKRMHQREELEELLACYLTLNSDEYHDLIIKVFKEVWFQLNQEGLVAEFQDRYCY